MKLEEFLKSCEKRNFNYKGWKYGKCFGTFKQLEERYLEFLIIKEKFLKLWKRFRFIVNGGLQWIFQNFGKKIIRIELRKKNFNCNVVKVLKLYERWKISDTVITGGL